MPKFSIKYNDIVPICNWLNELMLWPVESRARTKFIDILNRQLNEYFEKERQELIRKFTNKDTEGNPLIIIDSNGRRLYDVPKEKSDELNKEYQKLTDESYIIEIDDKNLGMFKFLKKIILNPDFRFGPREGDAQNVKVQKIQLANAYDHWAKMFEMLDI